MTALLAVEVVRIAAFVAVATVCGVGANDRADASEALTPLLLAVRDAPIPFPGSDGRTHLVYELEMANFSSGEIVVERVEVLGDSGILDTLDAKEIGERLQPIGTREPSGQLATSTTSILFVHVTLPQGATAPRELSHRVSLKASAAPPDRNEIAEEGGAVFVSESVPILISPPLAGERYISADSCCDASRHTRAILPVNGRAWIAQRYAVDWEQLTADGRIYVGPKDRLESYTIFGQPVLAVANAIVASTIDGLPEQLPGRYPPDPSLDAVDGNSVILDLGEGHYALYAHLQPGSLTVRQGDRVMTGQVLGRVGNSGNSIAPHLHFQITDGPKPAASNGLPYRIEGFQVTGKTAGTKAFDLAEDEGSVLAVSIVSPPQRVEGALPLDQLIISFPRH